MMEQIKIEPKECDEDSETSISINEAELKDEVKPLPICIMECEAVVSYIKTF